MKHVEYTALDSGICIMLVIGKGEMVSEMIPDWRINVPSYYYIIFNVFIYTLNCSDANGEFSFWMNEAGGICCCGVALVSQPLRAPGFNPVPVLCQGLKRPVSPMPPLISRVSQACKDLWGSGSLSLSPCLSGSKNILILTQSRKETCFSCSCVFKCPVERGWHCCRKLARALPGCGV